MKKTVSRQDIQEADELLPSLELGEADCSGLDPQYSYRFVCGHAPITSPSGPQGTRILAGECLACKLKQARKTQHSVSEGVQRTQDLRDSLRREVIESASRWVSVKVPGILATGQSGAVQIAVEENGATSITVYGSTITVDSDTLRTALDVLGLRT